MTADLIEERDFLLASLRDLDAEFAAGDLDPSDYQALRDDYTARAAVILRELDAIALRNDGALPPAQTARPAWTRRSVAVAAAVAIVAALVGLGVARSAGERTLSDEATGSLPEGSTDRITRAQLLVSEGKILDAVKVYDDLLADDPNNPVALAQKGWLLSRVDPSLVDTGLENIDRAIAADPAYPDAHFFRGMILWKSKGDPAGASESFQKAIDAKPPADLLPVLTQARDEALSEASAP